MMNEGFMACFVTIVQLRFMQWHKTWFVVFILDGRADLSHNHWKFAWHDEGSYTLLRQMVITSICTLHNNMPRCWYLIIWGWWFSSQQGNLVQNIHICGKPYKHLHRIPVWGMLKHHNLFSIAQRNIVNIMFVFLSLKWLHGQSRSW